MPVASALRAEKVIAERSRGAHPCVAQLASSVSQSLPTTLLPTEHVVARPTTHAVHNREC